MVVVPGGNQKGFEPALGQQGYAAAGQVTYLIAFKSGVVRLVDQYWVSGNTLYYLTGDHERRAAPLASVDRALSVRLNSERNVDFNLPEENQKQTYDACRPPYCERGAKAMLLRV